MLLQTSIDKLNCTDLLKTKDALTDKTEWGVILAPCSSSIAAGKPISLASLVLEEAF